MAEYHINAQLMRDMIVAAANCLEHHKDALNELNVFPVPDGDTGTNMSMTLLSAAREVMACPSNEIGKLANALSMGALKGARGNSGVILSQLFRGFPASVAQNQSYYTSEEFAKAVQLGVKAAYRAVMKPKEGTILTVANAMAEEARRQTEMGANLLSMIDAIIEAGEAMLKKTPEMLPVLKEAGVVDAGGAGLIAIYKGFKMAIDGEEIISDLDLTPEKSMQKEISAASARSDISTADIHFGYCTEFFIKNLEKGTTQESIDKLRDKLLQIGDSLVVVGDPELVKVHVHTNVPGKALQYALRLGELSKIKIDNMREQHSSLTEDFAAEAPVKEKKPMAMVAVAAGQGLEDIFRDINVDEIVAGGQSMNPSAQDISVAINHTGAETVFVLPDNKNIILAAEQAAALTESKVIVIPAKTFPQGLSAALAFDPDVSLEENEKNMREALHAVQSAQITHAVRDTQINGEVIKKDEVLGIKEDDIVAHGENLQDILIDLIGKMVNVDTSVISLYYGEDLTENQASALAESVENAFDDYDVELYSGKQALYDFIISVE